MAASYDFVIVGAGSAGCVLAERLSANKSARVLILEAGGSDNNIFIRMPTGFAYANKNPKFDWGYSSEPEPAINGRQMPCPRGRVLGGSSSVNALAFVRGNQNDYDRWADSLGDEWSYKNCLPYFKKLETFSGGENDYRGGSGPLSIIAPKCENPLYGAFLKACEQAGYQHLDDVNAARQEGFGPMDQTIADGVRASAASAYLVPAQQRENVTLQSGCMVTRILFEKKRAVGVEYVQDGKTHSAFASQEVILSAGAINSPHLLMLSGVGPAEMLEKAGVQCHHRLDGIGQNLQDHVDATVQHECLRSVSEMPQLLWYRKLLIGLQWLLFKNGPGATNHFEVAGYIRTDPELEQPNIQYCFIPLMVAYDGTAASNVRHGFQVSVMMLQPQSRGFIELASANPLTPPKLTFNYLQHPNDLHQIRDGIIALRTILAQSSMREYCGSEIFPGNEDIDSYVRRTCKSTHHLSSTCRMGNDEMSVTGPSGRVHGLEGLRVVDASIMPTITSGNINAPVMMIAEKIADMIHDGR